MSATAEETGCADAFGAAVHVGDAVTVVRLSPDMVPRLVAATVTGTLTEAERTWITVTPEELTPALCGEGTVAPGEVMRCKPESAIAHHRQAPGAAGPALVHCDAHGRELRVGDEVAFVFHGSYGMTCWARAVVESATGAAVVVSGDWVLPVFGQSVCDGQRMAWSASSASPIPRVGTTRALGRRWWRRSTIVSTRDTPARTA